MTYRKKLIEVALPLEAINVASAREKSIRHGHPSTLHLWWARRPLAAARAVIFTSLVDDPDATDAPPAFVAACKQLPKGKNVDANGDSPRMRLFDFIERLVTWEATTDDAILNTARELILLSTGGNPPPLLDPFAGGGSIPLEAQRLGLEAHASDLNPVAVMINKAQIEIPPRFANLPPVNPRDREKMFGGAPLTPKSPLPQGARGLEDTQDTPDRIAVPPKLQETMKEIARNLRREQTASEETLWQALRNRKLDKRKFRRQQPVGAFVLDFYCADERLAVEVDGAIHDYQQEADAQRQEILESLGIRFVRLSAQQVETDIDGALNTIRLAFLPSPQRGRGAGGEGQSIPPQPDTTYRGATGLAADVRYYGEWMRERAWERIGHLYPQYTPLTLNPSPTRGEGLQNMSAPQPTRGEGLQDMSAPQPTRGEGLQDMPLSPLPSVGERKEVRDDDALNSPSPQRGRGGEGVRAQKPETVIAWLWARTVKSPNPAVNAHVPLVRSFILSKKKGRECWAKPIVEGDTVRFEVTQGKPPKGADGTVNRRGGTCILSNEPIPFEYIRAEGKAGRMGAMLMAIVTEGTNGRSYYSPNDEHQITANQAEPEWIPMGDIPEQALGFRVQLYGMDEYNKLFTPRQLVALTTFSDLVAEARAQAHTDALAAGLPDDGIPLRDGGRGALAYAEAVSVYLAFAVDKGANIWSSITSWMNDRGAFRETFARQAIPMVWDFAEANPFSDSGGCFDLFLKRIVDGVIFLNGLEDGFVKQIDAQQYINPSLRIISTDPPYYDNIGYADLSDFFYVWMRKALRDVYPDIFGTMLVPKEPELIASPYRHGGKAAANAHFEGGMLQTFTNIRRFITPDYPLTVYYAFKQQDADAVEDDPEEDALTLNPSPTSGEGLQDMPFSPRPSVGEGQGVRDNSPSPQRGLRRGHVFKRAVCLG